MIDAESPNPSLLHGIRAIVFDAVGTLLFPYPPAVEVYAAAAARCGVCIPAETIRNRFRAAYQREEQIDRAANWRTSEARETERWQRIVAATLVEVGDTSQCFRELFAHFATPVAWRIHDELCRTFDALQHTGIALGMGSNFDARLFDVLSGFREFESLRGRIVVSSRVGLRKPAPGFFREVERVMGLAALHILFVGDDPVNDIEGATAAGLHAVSITEWSMFATREIARRLQL